MFIQASRIHSKTKLKIDDKDNWSNSNNNDSFNINNIKIIIVLAIRIVKIAMNIRKKITVFALLTIFDQLVTTKVLCTFVPVLLKQYSRKNIRVEYHLLLMLKMSNTQTNMANINCFMVSLPMEVKLKGKSLEIGNAKIQKQSILL